MIVLGALIAGLVLTAGPVVPEGWARQDGAAVEARYAAPGDLAVTSFSVPDEGPARFEVFHPTDIAHLAGPLPVVVWGNGSDATPAQYEALLRHLASWGMVVVAATTPNAGDGVEVLAAAHYAVAAGRDPASPLHGRIDGDAIGAAGHSQGAGGAVRASTASDGLIVTTVPISLPARIWVSPGKNHEYEPSRLTGSVLFLSGSNDIVISGPSVNRGYFDEAPEPAAMGLRRGADHLEPTGDGGGFRGYLTAWLRYQLMADTEAARAFVGGTAEFVHHPQWAHQATKGLTAPAASSPESPAPSTTAAPTETTGPTEPHHATERLPETGAASTLLALSGMLLAAAAAARVVGRVLAGPRQR